MHEPIYAAGGVVLRRCNHNIEVLVIHRPKYDDWSFPKGKAEPGETPVATALREIEEESSVIAVLLHDLEAVSYDTPQAALNKLVTYFVMTPKGEHDFKKNDEVDEVQWLGVDEAAKKLSYDNDIDLLRKAINIVKNKSLRLYSKEI